MDAKGERDPNYESMKFTRDETLKKISFLNSYKNTLLKLEEESKDQPELFDV